MCFHQLVAVGSDVVFFFFCFCFFFFFFFFLLILEKFHTKPTVGGRSNKIKIKRLSGPCWRNFIKL